jgi:hypothetical protein
MPFRCGCGTDHTDNGSFITLRPVGVRCAGNEQRRGPAAMKRKARRIHRAFRRRSGLQPRTNGRYLMRLGTMSPPKRLRRFSS